MERLTWSSWFVFRSTEDYGDPGVAARRREMLTVFFDLLLVTAAAIVWFIIGATIAAGASQAVGGNTRGHDPSRMSHPATRLSGQELRQRGARRR